MGENAPKISVIVPMYNAEKYLTLCVNSILNQTFKDFELILVDDCSADNTLEIAKSFSDSRIKIIRNEKNLGMPGVVRNVGIDTAQGEYIYFCDDDDAVLPNALEVLLKSAEENNADIINATRFYISKNPNFTTTKNLPLNIMVFSAAAPVSFDLKTRIYEEFLQSRIHIAPWIYLYRRNFLLENNIKFPDEVAEDVFFNFDAICATEKIIKTDIPFYIHRAHSNSTAANPMRIQKNISALWILNDHVEEKLACLNDEDFTRRVQMYWTAHVIRSYIVPFTENVQSKEVFKHILSALQFHFQKDSSFVFTLLKLHLQDLKFMKENQILREAVNQIALENQKLKATLENINQQIGKVLKA